MYTKSLDRSPETCDGSRSASLFSERYSPRVLPPLLRAGDLTALFLLNVYWVTNVTTLAAGGTASFTYWVIGGFAPTPFPSNILALFALAWVVLGLAYATFLARRAPERYERLGRIVRGEGS